MKTLFLIRHAKSSWNNSELSDHERPLNQRGQQDVPRMGKRLARRGVKAELVISSPALRAYSTALKIAAEIHYPEEGIQINDTLYFEGTRGMLEVVHGLLPEISTALLVGHNPAMTELINLLAQTNIGNVPTCGLAEIRFDVESWSDVGEDRGKLQIFDYPKRIDD